MVTYSVNWNFCILPPFYSPLQGTGYDRIYTPLRLYDNFSFSFLSSSVVESVEENVATSETSHTIPETNRETETAIAVESNNTENIEKEIVENTDNEVTATGEETN